MRVGGQRVGLGILMEDVPEAQVSALNTHQARRATSQFTTALVRYELSSPHRTRRSNTRQNKAKAKAKQLLPPSPPEGKAGSGPKLGKGRPLSPNAVYSFCYSGHIL